MKLKNQLLFILASILLLAGNCKKDKLPPAVLPPATQEGKNTIGFKVNGEVWVPYYKCSFSGDPCGEISARYGPPYASHYQLGFQVARKNGARSSALTISSLGEIKSIGNKYDSISINFMGENSTGNTDDWSKSPMAPPGIFEITKIDQANQIISGIFSFTLYENNGSGRSLEIKDGRFDFKMNACICT